RGLLEEAEGGTLFVDEIAELPLELQPLLLGAVERKSSVRIGSRKPIRYDIRVVASTSRNLLEEVRSGRFRQDLYFRLAVGRLRVPPLRERPEDLPRLVDLFARELGATVAPETLVPLYAYEWPGNLRQLRNTLAHMAARPSDGIVLPGAGGESS